MSDPAPDFVGLNFGCGGNILPGWRNMEIGDCDVRNLPLPFPEQHADMVLAEHLVEHLSGPDALRFLQDCWRILKPGGVMRLCCPVIGHWLTRDHAIDLTLNHGHLIILDEHLLRTLLWMAGFTHENIQRTGRAGMDGHHQIIGEALDERETCRLSAVKQ